MKLVVVGAALAAVAAAWLGAEPYVPPPLAGRTFVAVEFVHDGELRPVWAFGALTLRLTSDGRFLADAGCNLVHGTFRVSGGRFLTEGGTTDAGCGVEGVRRPPGYGIGPERYRLDVGSVLDEPLNELYSEGPGFRLRGSKLELTGSRSRLTLREFRSPAEIAEVERRKVAEDIDSRWTTKIA